MADFSDPRVRYEMPDYDYYDDPTFTRFHDWLQDKVREKIKETELDDPYVAGHYIEEADLWSIFNTEFYIGMNNVLIEVVESMVKYQKNNTSENYEEMEKSKKSLIDLIFSEPVRMLSNPKFYAEETEEYINSIP